MHGNSTRENRETLVAGFENRADAERFLQEWKDRLQKFGLELHPDKTRLIEFGRHAVGSRGREVVEVSRTRLLQLPRHTRQQG